MSHTATLAAVTHVHRLDELTRLLAYTWGCRQGCGYTGQSSADALLDTLRGIPDVLHVNLRASEIEVLRVTSWRRLDRDDISHTVKLVVRALWPGMTYAVSPTADAMLEIALQATLLQGGPVQSMGTYGLVRPAWVAEAGADPRRVSILRACIPVADWA